MQKGGLNYFRALIVATAVLMSLSRCAGKDGFGTETGNGFNTPSITGNVAMGVVDQLCTSIKVCNPSIDLTQCEAQLNQLPNLPEQLGVPASSGITTMTQLASAETAGTIVASDPNASDCVAQIAATPCTTSAAQAAYNPQTGSYAGVSTSLSLIKVCSEIY